MTGAFAYSCDVQLAHFDVFQVEDRGQVDADRALGILREFPFEEQLEAGRTLKDATAPTVNFRSRPDGAVLAIWALAPNRFEVHLETPGRQVSVEETDPRQIEQVLRDFFAGQREELRARLSARSHAEPQGLLGRIAALFRR